LSSCCWQLLLVVRTSRRTSSVSCRVRDSQMTRSTNSWHSVNLNSRDFNNKDSNNNHNRDFSNNRDSNNSKEASNNSHSKDSNSSHSKVSLGRALHPLSSLQLPNRPRCPPDQRCFSM